MLICKVLLLSSWSHVAIHLYHYQWWLYCCYSCYCYYCYYCYYCCCLLPCSIYLFICCYYLSSLLLLLLLLFLYPNPKVILPPWFHSTDPVSVLRTSQSIKSLINSKSVSHNHSNHSNDRVLLLFCLKANMEADPNYFLLSLFLPSQSYSSFIISVKLLSLSSLHQSLSFSSLCRSSLLLPSFVGLVGKLWNRSFSWEFKIEEISWITQWQRKRWNISTIDWGTNRYMGVV